MNHQIKSYLFSKPAHTSNLRTVLSIRWIKIIWKLDWKKFFIERKSWKILILILSLLLSTLEFLFNNLRSLLKKQKKNFEERHYNKAHLCTETFYKQQNVNIWEKKDDVYMNFKKLIKASIKAHKALCALLNVCINSYMRAYYVCA